MGNLPAKTSIHILCKGDKYSYIMSVWVSYIGTTLLESSKDGPIRSLTDIANIICSYTDAIERENRDWEIERKTCYKYMCILFEKAHIVELFVWI